ncbi:SIR2 family NAD-dependent protein deacylase [Aeromonas caviae]
MGAGLSYPYKLPLWGQALERLVTKLEGASKSDQRAMLPALQYLENVKELLNQWKYLEAAQLIYENHKTRFESFVLNTFDGSNVLEFFGVLDLLPQLSDGCIITTNFDNLIERVYTEKNRSIEGYMHGTQSRNQFASKLIQGERCILKLHGNYSDPETYIFSKSQYDQAYGEKSLDYTKPLAKVLRQIFVSHSLLFLGCSLETDKTLELFIDVVSSEAFDIPAHFAFLPDPSNHQKKLEKEDLLAKAKIHPIWYQVAIDDCGTQNHSQLEDLIKFAVACATGKAKV